MLNLYDGSLYVQNIQIPIQHSEYRYIDTDKGWCNFNRKALINRMGCSGAAVHEPTVTMSNAMHQLQAYNAPPASTGLWSSGTAFSGAPLG